MVEWVGEGGLPGSLGWLWRETSVKDDVIMEVYSLWTDDL